MFAFLSRLFSSGKTARMTLTPERRRAFTELMDSLARPGIDFRLLPDAPPVPVGGTKIGGCPDLPPDFVWPHYRVPEGDGTRPLAFMAQVNLAEAALHDPRHELPPTGMLLFFYDMESFCWGFNPADAGSACVLYVEDVTSLRRGRFPDALEAEYRYDERAVALAPALIPPDYANTDAKTEAAIAELAGGDGERGADWYIDLRQEYRGYGAGDENGTYLLGYPDIQQDVMEEECELVRRGYNTGGNDTRRPGEAEQAEIARAAQDWCLLFQLASIMDDGKSELMFGDLGNLYFWIRRQDLAARDFGKAWVILQCG